MADLLPALPVALRERAMFGIFDDFLTDQTDLTWIDTASDAGAVTIGDSVGGVASLAASDGTAADNDETYLEAANEFLKFAADKPIYAEARVQFAEAATSAANVAFGFIDAPGADSLVDDGAGIAASKDGAAIYKVDGGTVWLCFSGNGATRTVSTSTTTAGGASYQTLGIEVLDYTPTACQVTFTCDGVRLKDSNGRDIVHTVLYASATEMAPFVGVKNGGANLETLNVDYVAAYQAR